MATIGLKDVYYAKLLTDPVGGTPTYEAPVRLVGAISANVNPNTSTSTLFADDGPYDAATTMGEITLELGLADLPMAAQAALLGHTYSGGILKKSSSDVPPYVAIGYRSLKSDGTYRYMWLNKGKFAALEEEYQTKGDSVEFKTPTIKGAFVKRDSDGEWERMADESDAAFTADLKAAWFESPLGDVTP